MKEVQAMWNDMYSGHYYVQNSIYLVYSDSQEYPH